MCLRRTIALRTVKAALVAASLAALLSAASPAHVGAQRTDGPAFEVRLLTHQALVRSALGALVPPERRVPQYGAEVSLHTGWTPLRVEGRVLRSTHGGADLRSRDAGLTFGGRVLGIAVAYGDRGSYSPTTGLAHHREAAFARVGARVRWHARDSGLLLHLSADHYMAIRPQEQPTAKLRGAEVSTGLTYRHGLFPVTTTLGYRVERFRVFGVTQEVSALTFALGYIIDGH